MVAPHVRGWWNGDDLCKREAERVNYGGGFRGYYSGYTASPEPPPYNHANDESAGPIGTPVAVVTARTVVYRTILSTAWLPQGHSNQTWLFPDFKSLQVPPNTCKCALGHLSLLLSMSNIAPHVRGGWNSDDLCKREAERVYGVARTLPLQPLQ